ncbi:DNA polymerase III subunit gamma and tau [Gordonia sp. HNM0687]|uniref:DNA polymerase III subunit gamma/tau n=1 Tax=Gordonia mangrovi TaxID=2665643 RepID=A0A6L7GWM2_9ACTN|nr:DNA polymerase III subunit gamma and tau [Gordonia mangrovi]MXP24320.1 DNA polymerase III subunit gamma and tau [Gordonia mangrovi]UVF79864.1 DNA polymerase III subunit gamma and tau [Gordonia mangrovi]
MALYRTYRPASFADVVGQEHVTDPLSRALDGGRINHAYLFSGPRGCGKTSSARILARSLNCVHGPTSNPCGECDSCIALAPGGPGNLDVIELDAASHGGVDDTRELRDRAFYAPSESRYRVFIVDEAHMVTNAGFNALLKIVEEPPEHLIFVFATTEPEKVLPTIRSRTHHYPFRLLAPPVMRNLLEKICASENVVVAPDVYPLVIRAGGGSPRDSLSILDQLLAGAGDEGVTYERALALLGVTDIALIDEAIDALADADGAALFGTVEKVVDAGHDPRRFAVDLLERLRDLILLQAVPDAADRGLVEAPGDQLARMQRQIEVLGPASLTRFAETAHAALGEMRGTTSPRLLLEVMCARMLLPAASSDDAALLQRVERLESGVPAPSGSGSATRPSGGVSAPAEPEPAPKYVRPSQRKAAEEAAAARAEQEDAAPAASTPDGARATPAAGSPTTPVRAEPTAERSPTAEATEQVAPQQPSAPPTASQAPVSPEEPVSAPEPAESSSSDAPSAPPGTPAQPNPTPPNPTSPRPPARAAAQQATTSFDDDIPLPDEPTDDEMAPPPDYAEPAPAGAEQPTPATDSGLTVAEVEARWSDIRAAARGITPVLEVMLSGASIAGVDGTTVVFGHATEMLVGRLSNEHAGNLRAAVQQVFGSSADARCVHSTGQPAAQSAVQRGKADRAAAQAAPKRPTYSRPSRGRDQAASPAAVPESAPEPEEPEPPRADDELTDAERDEMVADARTGSPEQRLDPDQVALELLKSELGARPLE